MVKSKFKKLSDNEKDLIIKSMLEINDIYSNPIDLSICEKGDILITKTGIICRYLKNKDGVNDFYSHEVVYPNNVVGTRIDDGHAFKNNRMEYDHDIVKIIKVSK